MSGTHFSDDESQLITELHVWIGHCKDGREGVLVSEMHRNSILSPLMDCNRSRAEEFGEIARRIKRLSLNTSAELKSIELRTFKVVTS